MAVLAKRSVDLSKTSASPLNKPMTPHEKWLKRRRGLLTASDAAAVLGYDKFKGPLAVWANKVHGVDSEVSRPMRFGSFVEDFIDSEYEIESGYSLHDPGDFEISIHPDVPWLGATLDRECRTPDNGTGAVELKAISPRTCTAQQWVECPPQGYILQNQVQMACAEMLWGTLVAFIGGADLVWYDHLRDDELLASMYPLLDEFWGYVQRKEPPPDTIPGINIVAKRTWTETDGGTVQMEEYAELADKWEYHKEQKREHTKEEMSLQGQLRVKIENKSFGMLGDGTYLERKQFKDGRINLKRVRPGG